MMKTRSKTTDQVTALVVDHGLFLPWALHLGESYRRVLYHKLGTEAFPTLSKSCIGDGYEKVECISDPWELIDSGEIDLAIFPDLLDSGLQLHLEKLGIAVWGSRKGDAVELIREKFLKTLKELDLPVPTFQRIVGVTALREYLKDKQNLFIKISLYRGDFETSHWTDWGTDEGLLDVLAMRFGPLKEMVPFLVFEPIETDIEDGCDTWCIQGQFPDLVSRGIECKDKGLFSAVTPRVDLPDYLQEILDKFGPVLGHYDYRNLFSMEVRVKDDLAYFIDPTCRGPIPGSGTHMMLWENMAEVIWAGAHGEMVQPEPSANFAVECMLSCQSDDKAAWTVVDMPNKLRPWVKIGNSCEINDRIALPPEEGRDDLLGWLGAIGDTPSEAIEALKEHAALLPSNVTAHMEALVELVQEAEKMETEGIPLTDAPLPEPAEVVT